MAHKSKSSRSKSALPTPPARYRSFIKRFAELGQAWELIGLAGRRGPLDERQARLIKLAVALGALREGAVHASVRKALALGIPAEEIEQVVALSAGTLGLPATVAGWSWVRDLLEGAPAEKTAKKTAEKTDEKTAAPADLEPAAEAGRPGKKHKSGKKKSDKKKKSHARKHR